MRRIKNPVTNPIMLLLVPMIFFTTSCLNDGSASSSVTEDDPTRPAYPTVVNTGLAYGTPCKPPCWQKLIPGETSYQEATKILEQLEDSGQEVYVKPGWFDVGPPSGSARGLVFGRFEDNVVSDIQGAIEFNYPVGTLVEQFGPPDGVYRFDVEDSGDRDSCEEWEAPQPLARARSEPVHLLYPTQGLYFLMLQPASSGYICPEMLVTSFCYYESLSMLEALKDGRLGNLCKLEVLKGLTERDLINWHGFGRGY